MTSIGLKNILQHVIKNKFIYLYMCPVSISTIAGGIYGGYKAYQDTIPNFKEQYLNKKINWSEMILQQTFLTSGGCILGSGLGFLNGIYYPVSIFVILGNIYVANQVNINRDK